MSVALAMFLPEAAHFNTNSERKIENKYATLSRDK